MMILSLKIAVVLGGYSVACLGAGGIVLQALTRIARQPSRSSAGTDLATAFILGQGFLASLWLLLALGGWFSAHLIAVIVFVVAVGGLYLMRRRLIAFRHQVLKIWRELRADSWAWQLLAALTVFLCLLWATSLGRTMEGDAGAFYMAISKVVAHSRQLLPLRGYEDFSTVGLQGEMHHAAMIALHSPDAAQLFAWPTSIAGALMLLALGRQVGMGRRGQWITLAIFYSSSAIIYMSGSGKVDIFALTLGIAAYYWALQIYVDASPLSFWLTGLFFGFAIIAKVSYLPVMGVSLFLLVLWGLLARNSNGLSSGNVLKSITGAGFQIVLAFIIAVLPHLLKNGVFFDNPFAPFVGGSEGWANQDWFSPETTRRILLAYPLSLTYGNYWGQGGGLSPLVLAFFPLLIFLPRPRSWWRSPLVAVTLSAIGGALAWVILRPSVFAPRYILAPLVLLTLLPAKAADYVSRMETRPRWLSAGVVVGVFITVISVGPIFVDDVFFPEKSYRYLSGELGLCGREWEYCGHHVLLNRKAEFGDRILLGSYQRYWLRSDLMQCVSNIEDEVAIFSAPEEDRWLTIYQRGFRYLLAEKTTHAQFLEMIDRNNLPDWLNLVEISNSGHVVVYRLDVTVPPGDQLLACQRRGNSKVWEVVSP